MKRLPYLFALSVGLMAVTGFNAIAALQPTTAFDPASQLLLANRLRNRGMRFRVRPSRYRIGAFSRGSCPEGAVPVVPVVEEAESQKTAPAYLTASAHPTFFINIPEMSEASGFIYVDDPNSTERSPQLYKAAFDLGDKAGIVGIQMPSDAPPLQEGSSYRWRVVIRCGSETDQTGTVVFSGGEIERVADIEGTTEERLEYYLQEGVWQEAALIIAEDRYYNPQSAGADEDWTLLMQESGIAQFAEVPIIDITESRLSDN